MNGKSRIIAFEKCNGMLRHSHSYFRSPTQRTITPKKKKANEIVTKNKNPFSFLLSMHSDVKGMERERCITSRLCR